MMRALLLIARSQTRSRVPALVSLAILIGIAGAVVLAALAGTRRTASAVERFLTASDTSEIQVEVEPGTDTHELAAQIATISGVADTAPVKFFFADVGTEFDFGVLASDNPAWLSDFDRPRVIEGRFPETAFEIALNEPAVEQLGVGIGDRIGGATMTPAEYDNLLLGGGFTGLSGPELDFEVVGVVRVPRDLPDDKRNVNPGGVAGPGFYAQYDRLVGGADFFVAVDVDTGAELASVADAIEAGLDPDARAIVSFPVEDTLESVDGNVGVLVVGLLVFASVSFVAGAFVVGQALSRHVAGAAADARTMRALGAARSGAAAALALAALPAVSAGALLAFAGAIALSPFFPFGLPGRAEPEPGIAIDWTVVALGSAAVALLGGACAFVSALWLLRTMPVTPPAGHFARLAAALARAGAPVGMTTGARLAFDREGGRGRAAVLGTTVGLAGLVATLAFASSASRLSSSPERWGRNWDLGPIDVVFELTEENIANATTAVENDPGLGAAALLEEAVVELDGTLVEAMSLDVVRGSIPYTLLAGRAPVGRSEVVLGSRTAEQLGVGVGDEVAAASPAAGDAATLSVVGLAVIQEISSNGPGEGAILSPDAIAAHRPQVSLVVRLAPGTDQGAMERRLEAAGFQFTVYAEHVMPLPVANLRQVQVVPWALAAFFATLGVGGLAHALVTSVRRRRHDLAVLEALGCVHAEVRGAVRWQAVFTVLGGAIGGIPLGIALGRWIWWLVASGIGVQSDVALSLRQVLAVLSLGIAVAVVVALVPGWAATRRSPGAALRAE